MSDSPLCRKAYDQSKPYEIRIKGHLDARWSDWFDGLTISIEDTGNTRLTGHIADQAALHGFLTKIRDLGLPLISLTPVSSHQETENINTENIHHEHSSFLPTHDTSSL